MIKIVKCLLCNEIHAIVLLKLQLLIKKKKVNMCEFGFLQLHKYEHGGKTDRKLDAFVF